MPLQVRDTALIAIGRADQQTRDQMISAIDPAYFIHNFCQIFSVEEQGWIPFGLWHEQRQVLDLFHHQKKVVVLKARQLGLSWLALAYGLWLMTFRPPAVILIFSRGESEANYLISEERLRGMYNRLPRHLRVPSRGREFTKRLRLQNGSIAFAFPTTGGDGYTASLAIVDEADLVARLPKLMRAVKPTVDGGGKLFLISRADKDRPDSMFKQIYRASLTGADLSWARVFLPWMVRPSRDAAFYAEIKNEIFQRTGGVDELWEQYPATDDEALRPATLNKRIPPQQLESCLADGAEPLPEEYWGDNPPIVPGIVVYEPPDKVKRLRYYIGVDTAAGLPTSNNSATYVIDEEGNEVAHHVGKIPPTMQARAIKDIALWYNNATIMVEDNYHGFTVLEWLKENKMFPFLSRGHDGRNLGWRTHKKSKNILYELLAESVRNESVLIRDYAAFLEIQSIGKDTLEAPPGGADDRSDAFALALAARRYGQQPVSVDVFDLD